VRESRDEKRKRVGRILRGLARSYPEATCALRHSNELELLVATILSAQCTDQRVNLVTRELFAKYRTAEDYAAADPKELEREIHSAGFFRNKTKSILGAARRILQAYGGRVPERMEELVTLPGVARKTANVLLGTWFKKNEGVVVDTHVFRIARRLRLSAGREPEKVERDLMALFPRSDWTSAAHRLIWHGRRVCRARNPDCAGCPLRRECPSAGEAGAG